MYDVRVGKSLHNNFPKEPSSTPHGPDFPRVKFSACLAASGRKAPGAKICFLLLRPFCALVPWGGTELTELVGGCSWKGNPRTWNAKCPIFLGNFTPKTNNYYLKNRALGFPRTKKHKPGDSKWPNLIPDRWRSRFAFERVTFSPSQKGHGLNHQETVGVFDVFGASIPPPKQNKIKVL